MDKRSKGLADLVKQNRNLSTFDINTNSIGSLRNTMFHDPSIDYMIRDKAQNHYEKSLKVKNS